MNHRSLIRFHPNFHLVEIAKILAFAGIRLHSDRRGGAVAVRQPVAQAVNEPINTTGECLPRTPT